MAKREVKAKKIFLMPDGSETSHASHDAVELSFRFNGGGVHSVKLSEFSEEIRTCLGWNGLSQKLGDVYAGDDNAEDAEESFETALERLRAGEWVKAREGVGPSPTLIFEAIKAAKAEANMPYDEAATKEKYKTKEARDTVLKVPQIKAHYERLRAERAAARAAEAAKHAQAASGDMAAVSAV